VEPFESTLPAELVAGLDLQVYVRCSRYPLPLWTLKAVIRGPAQIDLTATAEGTLNLFEVAAAVTSEWTPGKYWCSLRATNGTQTFEVNRSEICIRQDLETVTEPYDGRSQNEIALEAIKAVIAGRATRDQERYRIKDRELWRMPVAELLTLKAMLNSQVIRERKRKMGSRSFGRRIDVSFRDL
jgi:hypothetical protein